MRHPKTSAAMGAIVGSAATCAVMLSLGLAPQDENPSLHRTSYAIGHAIALSAVQRLHADAVEFDTPSLMRGIEDGILGRDPAFSSEQMRASLAVLEREVTTRDALARMDADPVFRALAAENLRKGKEFIERFAAGEGSRELADGIFVRVLASGQGASPGPNDVVTVSFQARLIDRTLVSDESDFRAEIAGMIPGAQAVLQRMKPGDRWIVAIPSEQAFGIAGHEPAIGPNEAILVDVTLLEIE
jgi:FKBP-type peptidyl-prolyl cis-trans isomerase FklB